MFSNDFFVSTIFEHHQYELEEQARQAHLAKIARDRKKQLRHLAGTRPGKSQTTPEHKRG